MSEDKGFKVTDRRAGATESTGTADNVTAETSPENVCDEVEFPELNFSTFILSLSTSVLVSLGELPDPISNQKWINLPVAKQTITIIEILKEKSKGNLTPEEERLIEEMLYDLRLKYVESVKTCS
jgi:hypothetical protein